jgi:hypothetical protein
MIRPRASKNGRRSAWTLGDHQGEEPDIACFRYRTILREGPAFLPELLAFAARTSMLRAE